MRIFRLKQKKTVSYFSLISTLFVLLLFIAPLPAFTQEAGSIDALRQIGKAFADIAEKASPAVVSIKAKRVVTQEHSMMPEWPFGERFDPFEDDIFEWFFRPRSPRRRPQQRKFYRPVQGSGFIVSADGYIITNNHLVEDTEKITIKVGDDPEVEAKVIGTDPDSDVAVVKIDADNLPFLELANSDELEVGEWVIAIGNPFGLSRTVTAGIVSAKGRSRLGLTEIEDYIQTDAAINPGNSGGPLLNIDGKVVGINTAIVTGELAYRGNVGIGFAIPINMAKAAYDQLLESGKVVRGFLGVGIQNLTSKEAPFFGLQKGDKGVLVPEVTEDSAAEKAGLKYGDIIIEFNGQPVETDTELQRRVAMLKPGTEVEIVVLRDGRRKTLTATLGERSSKGQIARGGQETQEKLGLVVQNLTDDLAERLGYEGLTGVVVTDVEPGSIAQLAGITPGTLIMEVNRKPVKNTKDFNEAMEEAVKGGDVLMLIADRRVSRKYYVILTLPKE
ncbi:MAG: Do family serine endopeptidase [Planctomycetota bacterium]|jgi:serine protease Do